MAEMDERLSGWVDLAVYDAEGEKIGTVVDVRYGKNTGELVWLIVKTGLLGLKKVAVPSNEVERQGGRVVVRLDKGRITSAPGVSTGKILADDEERDICTYYGFDFVSSPWKPTEGCVDDEGQAAGPGA
ncbi:MAG: PRC-barrel domain containing protein [Actinobacteria bacterium]|jgi:sporulation protein YlmC with PRC-barrel domain|nr:PRC-barrel domain containing protein [Actinomycetota bacterium]